MASEKKVWEIIRDAGFDPLEDRGIIVKYAPENLSGKIADFFSMEFYVLQLCREELVLVPFSTLTAGLKKEVTLQIPYADIRSVEVREDLLNYQILIQTGSDMIRFTTQQKELSEFRSSGALSGAMNWHRKNLDATLKADAPPKSIWRRGAKTDGTKTGRTGNTKEEGIGHFSGNHPDCPGAFLGGVCVRSISGE